MSVCIQSHRDFAIPKLSEYAKILRVEKKLGHVWMYC